MSRAGIQVSLAAETGPVFTGFLLAKVWYGEFGSTEPVAVLDTIGAHPDFRGRGVGAALFEQLRMNLRGLGIATIRTEVSWDAQTLLQFFHHERFRPAARICLEADVEDPVLRERAERRAEEAGGGGDDPLVRRLRLIATGRSGAACTREGRGPAACTLGPMKLSKSARYALYAASEMAAAGDRPVTVADVAQSYGIPTAALAKIFQQLVRAGIAAGTRGVGGGYRLARRAKDLTLLDVMHVYDAPRDDAACPLVEGPVAGACGHSAACRLRRLFDEVDEMVRCTFASVSLATLAGTNGRERPARAR